MNLRTCVVPVAVLSRPQRSFIPLLCALLLALLLSACVTKPPLNADDVSVNLSPDEIKANPAEAKGTVIWGGVIVSSVNLADRTQIEMLAYPLDRRQRPITTKKPGGRFLLQSPGYLETENYSPGRVLTALGTLQGLTSGNVGDASYDYPTVTISNVHLWRQDNNSDQPRFIFGIGVNVGG